MEKDHTADSIERLHAFIQEAELLKVQERTAWNSAGKRESVAEHSWRLALLVFAIEPELRDLDISKLLRMAIVHDLGEAYDGDVSAAEQEDSRRKEETERRAVKRLTSRLPPEAAAAIADAWEEYSRADTPEAHIVKALDKIETIIQHNQGANPDDFDYRFNLQYGSKWADAHPAVRKLRQIVDAATEARSTGIHDPVDGE